MRLGSNTDEPELCFLLEAGSRPGRSGRVVTGGREFNFVESKEVIPEPARDPESV